MKKLFLLLFFTSFICLNLNAKIIYTIPNGVSDWTTVGAGSMTLPYNLQYGMWAAGIGDTLLLSGTFVRSSQIYVEKTNFTLGSWGSGATIQGSNDTATPGVNLLVLKNATNVTVENITFSQNFGNGARGVYAWGKGDNVTIKNCVFTNIGWSTSTTAIAPGGQGAHAILVLGNKNEASYTNISIIGNSVTNCITGWSESISVVGNVDGFLVADNYLADITNIGIDVAGHFSWVKDWDTNVALLDSLNQARNGRIRNNTVTNAISPIATSAGIYCDGCKNVIIERNVVSNSGAGISIGCEVGGGFTASEVTVMNNIIKNNKESGMFLGSSLSEGAIHGVSSVDNCIVKNNTFYKNGAANTSNNYEVFLQNSKNNQFYNNIIYIGNQARGIVSAFGKNVENFTMDYNLFYRENGSTADLVISTTSLLSGNAHSHFGDPGFTGEFNISPTSRAANTGDPTTVVLVGELDRDGSARVFGASIIDIGAQESASTQSAPAPNFYLTNIIGEIGSLIVTQTNATQWHTVNLANAYTSAVVIMSPLSFTDCDPATVRVKNVGATSFQYQIDEWDYLDGANAASETLFYMVIEAGMYDLDGGVSLQAGNISVNQSWSTIDYPSTFGTDPFVFTQIVTNNETTAATTRLRYIDGINFDVKIQEEEESAGVHTNETVSWIAITPGAGDAGRSYETDGTDDDYDDFFTELYFNNSYVNPVFFAQMQTSEDENPCVLRYQSLTVDQVEIKVEEEQSEDSEMSHDYEALGFMVFEAVGNLNGILVPPSGSSIMSFPGNNNDFVHSNKNLNSLNIDVFPNPVSDKINLSYQLETESLVEIQVFDIKGRKYIEERLMQDEGRQTVGIPVSSLPKGVFLVNVSFGNQVYAQEIIIQ